MIPALSEGAQKYIRQQAYRFNRYVRDYIIETNTGGIIGAYGVGSMPIPSLIDCQDTGETRTLGSVRACFGDACSGNITLPISDFIRGE